jgi:hypothetical protein
MSIVPVSLAPPQLKKDDEKINITHKNSSTGTIGQVDATTVILVSISYRYL